MYSNSPENFCFSTTYFALYRTIFDPIKHAVDIAITNAITGALTILPSQVYKGPIKLSIEKSI